MIEEWSPCENITWCYSASTQQEINFTANALETQEVDDLIEEALFLTPLLETIELPNRLLSCDYIFVDGCYGENAEPFALEWIFNIQKQLKEAGSEAQLVIEGIGDNPTYKDEPVNTNRKQFYKIAVEKLLAKLNLN